MSIMNFQLFPQDVHVLDFHGFSIFSLMLFLLLQDPPGHWPCQRRGEASAYITAVDSAFSSLEEHGAPSMDMA